MGAVTPVLRNAAIKLVTFQSPWDVLATRRAPAQPRHVGHRPRFIKKHELLAIPSGLIEPPLLSSLPHVRAFLLAGVQRFF